MYEVLFAALDEKAKLTTEEKEVCKDFFVPKRLRKKQVILHQDDICKNSIFVEKGTLRSYTIDNSGYEHVIQFAFDGWWIADLYSFLTNEPSTYNIDALEDSEVLLISQAAQEEMFEKVPKMERYFRILCQNALIAMQRRLAGTLTLNAEEKYTKLIAYYPDVAQRVPQHMIASYLGITPETLSRIRRQIATRR